MTRAALASLLVLVASGRVAAEEPPPPAELRDPTWAGRAPGAGEPTYEEALDRLRRYVQVHPGGGTAARVAAPVPCVLRIVRTDVLPAGREGTAGALVEAIWIDLGRVVDVDAEAVGAKPPIAPAPVATCAWFAGEPGFALRTERFTPPGAKAPVASPELEQVAIPRVCIGGDGDPAALIDPIRELVGRCGGHLPAAAAVRAAKPVTP